MLRFAPSCLGFLKNVLGPFWDLLKFSTREQVLGLVDSYSRLSLPEHADIFLKIWYLEDGQQFRQGTQFRKAAGYIQTPVQVIKLRCPIQAEVQIIDVDDSDHENMDVKPSVEALNARDREKHDDELYAGWEGVEGEKDLASLIESYECHKEAIPAELKAGFELLKLKKVQRQTDLI